MKVFLCGKGKAAEDILVRLVHGGVQAVASDLSQQLLEQARRAFDSGQIDDEPMTIGVNGNGRN